MNHRLSLPCFAAAVMLALPPLSEKASAQYSSDYSIGIRGGANWGYISNIGGILISEDYYSNYTLKENKKAGGVGCLFLNARIPETILAFQPEISYSTRSTKLRYDDVYGLWYEADFKYQFVCIGVMAKVYPVAGLNIEIGAQVGINVTPNGIEYKSNGEKLGLAGPDIETRDQMRQVLEGNHEFAVMAGIGYEFSFGLCLDARYVWGLSDAISTEYNTYKFIENKNCSRTLEFTIGYAYSFGKTSGKRRK